MRGGMRVVMMVVAEWSGGHSGQKKKRKER